MKMPPVVARLLSYSSVREVTYQDWRLGLMFYSFLMAIFAYICIYTLLFSKGYLLIDNPIGTIGILLLDLFYIQPFTTLPYCSQSNMSVPGIVPQTCRAEPPQFVHYPNLEESAIFITTRVTEQLQNRSTYCQHMEYASCEWQDIDNSTTYILGNVENYPVQIQHSFFASRLNISRTSQSMAGVLLGSTGEVINPCDDFAPGACPANVSFGEAGEVDMVPVRTLMRAAGIPVSANDPGLASVLYNGSVIVVTILYDNTNRDSFDYDLKTFTYTAKVRLVNNFFRAYELYRPTPQTQMVMTRNGIRIVFVQSGTIGKFDFQVMLVQLVSGIGLLAVAKLVCDFLATHVLPQKDLYASCKTLVTPLVIDKRDMSVTEELLGHSRDPELRGSQLEYRPPRSVAVQ